MMKRIISCLLVCFLLLGLCPAALAAAGSPTATAAVTANAQGSATVVLTVKAGSGSSHGRVTATMPAGLTLASARSLLGSKGIADLSSTKTSLRFAWACYADLKKDTAALELKLTGKPGVYALERAAKAGVEGCVVRRKDYASSEDFDAALLKTLKDHNIDLVVLAGFLSVLGPSVIEAYPRRILNVHPALIPSFCGPGMYGLRPHEAALARGCKVTGATVHFVNEECDGGPILLQKAVDILPGDTPEVLQKRVMEQAEWKLLPKAVAMVCSGEIE